MHRHEPLGNQGLKIPHTVGASTLSPRTLLENLPDKPDVTERVDDGALEHPPDRPRSYRRVRMFPHWTVLDSAGGQRLPVDRDGVVHEELDPHGRETHRRWAARAVRGRL